MASNIEDYIETHIEAGDIKVGYYVIIHLAPCKIKKISFSKTGKHGHAKAVMTGIDILTGKKHDYCCTSSASLPVPKVDTYKWCLSHIDEENGDITLLNDDNEEEILPLPNEDNTNEDDQKVKEEILKKGATLGDDDGALIIVTVLKCFGKYRLIDCCYSTK
jgi:translation initiation factor 5A